MKTIPIDTGAAWASTLTTFIDGDVFRESNTDLCAEDIGDRLGYLKTQVDAKPSLSVANTWTALQTFKVSGVSVASTMLWREAQMVSEATDATESARTGLIYRSKTLLDVDGSYNPVAELFRVPQTTGNRIYQFASSAGNPGRVIRITRPRAADAHTVTIRDGSGNTICVMPVSAVAWVDIYDAQSGATANWRYLAGSSNLTSVSADV